MSRGRIFLYDKNVYSDDMKERYPHLWAIHGARDGVILPKYKENKLFLDLSPDDQEVVLNEALDYIYSVRCLKSSKELYKKWMISKIKNKENMSQAQINAALYDTYFNGFRWNSRVKICPIV